jgi:hypothetical protein
MDVDLSTAMSGLKSAIDLMRNAIGLAREANELSKDGAAKQAAATGLLEAERATRLAEAQIAQALGYKLCQCAFPPHIMLSEGYEPRYGEEIFRCPACKKQLPSEKYFESMRAVDTHNANLGRDGWLSR